MFNIVQKTIDFGDGRTIVLETGKLARQADGAILLKQGKTMLLATVVTAKEAKADVDFMPLSVEYKEKFASTGRFPGGFMKRESKPSDYEILVSRLVDRALRPLFPDDYHAETFVTISLISADRSIMPDALAGLAASAALAVSNVPFNGPISEVRVGRVDGNFIVNPTFEECAKADLDIMVAATMDNIMMVEGEMNEVSEADMLEALKVAHAEIKKHCKAQLEIMEMVGKTKKMEYSHEVNDEDLRKAVKEYCYEKVYKVAKSQLGKHERMDAFEAVKNEFIETLPEEEREAKQPLVNKYYHDVEKEAMRNMILDEGIRLDGRKTDQIRPIACELDILPAAHGSALFTRGETQSLTTVTLGTKLDEKIVDEVLVQGSEKFTLHYNFPPFSTGDAKPSRGISRREIGHGNLALRALKKVLPSGTDNPYAIRVVSDILESNGSSSMATVCAGTLALMDAGIKIKAPVSGIAMGLISDSKTGKFAILSDILGDEDHLGDMDFKVTGTAKGITATQMDIKVDGLSYEILAKALEQAKAGRMHILGKITDTISEPRPELKPHAPRIVQIVIPKEMIGAIIGTGGKIIQEIQSVTGTTIVIEEIDNKGVVDIFAENQDSIEAALRRINAITEMPEAGKVYQGKVKSITAFGAFVEIMPGKEGLLHISEVDWKHLANLDGILKEGDEVEVKLLEVDKKTGKLKLSRKALLPRPERTEQSDRPERRDRPERSDRPDNRNERHERHDRPDRPRNNN
jgi:polyribonucleotide nucleotidyltransferase